MKANLPANEPRTLEFWEKIDIYHKIRESRSGSPYYVLHDGPPYANGHVHLGTALNKILKDIIIKVKTMQGLDAPYVPGWDCHGMPIEHQVTATMDDESRRGDRMELRRRCRAYAEKYISVQREEFKRLGVFGQWDKPYLTMHYSYEAKVIEVLKKLVSQGYVYKGLRPIHWCATCQTALAEAEVEFHEETSPSIYVAFRVKEGQEKVKDLGLAEFPGLSFLIWTTTPWTLPANLAIAVHPDLQYGVVEAGDRTLIIQEDLVEETMKNLGVESFRVLHKVRGDAMEWIVCAHPFIDRDSVIILADYVSTDQGTGCVHTAPGHGQEDFEIGLKYKLPIFSPVNARGEFTDEIDKFSGINVFQANEKILHFLDDLGVLLASGEITHSYPHCWRCKKPVIFRATKQWFLNVDEKNLRQRLLDSIEETQWVPAWGKERIKNMVEIRPDWCLSRQRAWGIPIPAVYCLSCGHAILDAELIERVRLRVKESGSDIWFTADVKEFLGERTTCPKCGHENLEKETDILDVWFDSSVSYQAVFEEYPHLGWPCDLYLEAGDQHRGWFQLSLITSMASLDKSSFREVLTHGLILDKRAKKMSKSLGNAISPEDIVNKFGADILRLLFASVDYTSDIRFTEELIRPIVETYRKIRNTCRYLLGNLYDFNPSSDMVSFNQLTEIDRYALNRLNVLITRILKAYDSYEFHRVYHTLVNYCTEDLSSFYLDILKDRLYISYPSSGERRSSQTAIYHICSAITRLMAPLIPFTAEEIWQHLPGSEDKKESIHLTIFPEVRVEVQDETLVEKWEILIQVRDEVLKALEVARQQKIVGNSLEAAIKLSAPEAVLRLLRTNEQELPFLFIVSRVQLLEDIESGFPSEQIEGLKLKVEPAEGEKCPRCWNFVMTIGQNRDEPSLCSRCAAVVTRLKREAGNAPA